MHRQVQNLVHAYSSEAGQEFEMILTSTEPGRVIYDFGDALRLTLSLKWWIPVRSLYKTNWLG